MRCLTFPIPVITIFVFGFPLYKISPIPVRTAFNDTAAHNFILPQPVSVTSAFCTWQLSALIPPLPVRCAFNVLAAPIFIFPEPERVTSAFCTRQFAASITPLPESIIFRSEAVPSIISTFPAPLVIILFKLGKKTSMVNFVGQ